jgi:aminoglycoside phosphotransferase (APT) family kinase protein
LRKSGILVRGRHKRKDPHDHGQGWLPAVIPADARRFRVVHPELAAGLTYAGAELVEREPDVEIAPLGELRGEAPFAVVSIAGPPRGGSLPVRAVGRLASSLRALVGAGLVRRAMRSRGYPYVEVIRWDVGHTFALSQSEDGRTRLAEYLPERALVVGRRGERAPTPLESTLAEASREAGVEIRPRWASIRAGLVVVAGESAALRVAIGWARVQIAGQAAALSALHDATPPPLVAERVPWLLGRGRVGLADWSLERFLPGARPPQELTPALLDDCVDFLIALRRVSGAEAGGRSLTELADTAASVCRPESATFVRRLGQQLESELAHVPRGFAHGDFFAGNVLAVGDRLTGVLDWDGGGPGRLPLVDLLHLQLTRVFRGTDDEWGRALVERLLPSVRAGGDSAVRRYCVEVGLDRDSRLLEALGVAYWLEYVAYQLRTHASRRTEPRWIEGNVERVLDELRRLRPAHA